LTGNRGFFEICSFKSELHSPDAKTPANARPNGHASIGLRVLQRWGKRVFHIQPAEETPFRRVCQKFFISKAVFLKACRMEK
jgi:hypothetical protein